LSKLTIATRTSPLALWQANFVADELSKLDHSSELLKMKTQGDKILDVSLSKIGGKGLFVKELEHALYNKEADLAVHSMKDVPMQMPEGLQLAVICQREDPRDAFVSTQFAKLDELPEGAVVGTSSLRRQSQLLAYRPDLKIEFLRGNVQTRLQTLNDGQYDAIILAAAGLKRLGLANLVSEFLSPELCLPAAGQGAVGIEIREGDQQTLEAIYPLLDHQTTLCVTAERAVNTRMNGGCQVPIAAYAELKGTRLSMMARIGTIDGKTMLEELHHLDIGAKDFEEDMAAVWGWGTAIAEKLLERGGQAILDELMSESDH
jgi:hydroxymethylbilane synthase